MSRYVYEDRTMGYSWLTRGESVNVKRLTFEGQIVGYPSVNLSHTLSTNEKIEYHIRIKICKLITLKF